MLTCYLSRLHYYTYLNTPILCHWPIIRLPVRSMTWKKHRRPIVYCVVYVPSFFLISIYLYPEVGPPIPILNSWHDIWLAAVELSVNTSYLPRSLLAYISMHLWSHQAYFTIFRMGEISLNTRYLSTNRGIIKILQVICGFIICSLLCTQWWEN